MLHHYFFTAEELKPLLESMSVVFGAEQLPDPVNEDHSEALPWDYYAYLVPPNTPFAAITEADQATYLGRRGDRCKQRRVCYLISNPASSADTEPFVIPVMVFYDADGTAGNFNLVGSYSDEISQLTLQFLGVETIKLVKPTTNKLDEMNLIFTAEVILRMFDKDDASAFPYIKPMREKLFFIAVSRLVPDMVTQYLTGLAKLLYLQRLLSVLVRRTYDEDLFTLRQIKFFCSVLVQDKIPNFTVEDLISKFHTDDVAAWTQDLFTLYSGSPIDLEATNLNQILKISEIKIALALIRLQRDIYTASLSRRARSFALLKSCFNATTDILGLITPASLLAPIPSLFGKLSELTRYRIPPTVITPLTHAAWYTGLGLTFLMDAATRNSMMLSFAVFRLPQLCDTIFSAIKPTFQTLKLPMPAWVNQFAKTFFLPKVYFVLASLLLAGYESYNAQHEKPILLCCLALSLKHLCSGLLKRKADISLDEAEEFGLYFLIRYLADFGLTKFYDRLSMNNICEQMLEQSQSHLSEQTYTFSCNATPTGSVSILDVDTNEGVNHRIQCEHRLLGRYSLFGGSLPMASKYELLPCEPRVTKDPQI